MKLQNTYVYLIISGIFLFCMMSIPCRAQLPIVGSVHDLLSNEGLDGVEIYLKNINYATTSDELGNFLIPAYLFAEADSSSLKGDMYLREHHLEWHFNTNFDLLVFDLNGRILYQQHNLPPDGQYTLSINNGIHYVKLSSGLGDRTYSLLSVNSTRFLSKSQSIVSNQNPGVVKDSIFLSKEDYFQQGAALILSESDLSYVQDYQLVKHSYDEIHYFLSLPDKHAFDMVSSLPSKTHLGDVESIKAIVNSDNDFVYYTNTNEYNSHYDFAKVQLDYPHSHAMFNATQYVNHSGRYLFPITINYFKEMGLYTFEFFSGDEASCSDVKWCFERLKATSFLDDQLYFYSTNQSWDNCNQVPVITSNELYEGQNYQALNIAENYGYFRKLELSELAEAELQRHDLVLVNGLPIDIPVIAGIITTEFQTPLSHINVLSHNRGTPNMALRDGFTNPKLDFQDGQLVCLSVQSDSFIARSATMEEATLFWSQNEPVDSIVLEMDGFNYGLVDLDGASINDVSKIGGKAANYAELINAYTTQGLTPPVPEGFFAIPFYFYEQHMQSNMLDQYLIEMLSDSSFQSNIQVRKETLEKLRDTIVSTVLSQELLYLITQELESYPAYSSFRFRSSTNAEDLEGFNGAGLYGSFSGKLNNPERPVDQAIKQVWASLWNFTAFEERDYFKIDHLSCAMGVLVHRSFPDEDANGVAITKNPYNTNHAFIINVQYGDVSIVDPQPGVIHDQIVIYTYTIGQVPYTIEYLSHSNLLLHSTSNVMSDSELYNLADNLTLIKQYFYNQVYNCNCTYQQFGLDLEFKIDSDLTPRRLYIKQVRPY